MVHLTLAAPLRVPQPPLGRLDPRHQRRVLSAKELRKILRAAERGKPFRGIVGRGLHALSVRALHRASRVRAGDLTPASFNLKAKPPTVTVAADYSKRRTKDTVTLRADLAWKLKARLKRRVGLRLLDRPWLLAALQSVIRTLDETSVVVLLGIVGGRRDHRRFGAGGDRRSTRA